MRIKQLAIFVHQLIGSASRKSVDNQLSVSLEYLTSCFYPSADKGVLLHFDPLPFINTNQIAARTLNFVSITDAIIPDYPAFPTM
jgi:hypothetical protein